jgi:hypoxia up-regulated 1
MKARAKVLETHLHKLWKRKVPKTAKKPISTSSTVTATTSSTTLAAKATPGIDDADETMGDSVESDSEIPMTEELDRLNMRIKSYKITSFACRDHAK